MKYKLAFVHIFAVAMLLAAPALPDLAEEPDTSNLPYEKMAARIASALALAKGETVLIGNDPSHMPALTEQTETALRAAGAVVARHTYGEGDSLAAGLARSDVFIWLPFAPDAEPRSLVADFSLTSAWVDEGLHRQIHFHWGDGTRAADGMQGVHSPEYDTVYTQALDIDYKEMGRQMDAAVSLLQAGAIHVTTPAGTDMRFRTGKRVFTRQNGDASRQAMQSAQVRIQKEIELPAGAIRVAPLEASASGTMVVPYARLEANPWNRREEEPPVRNLRLTFKDGKITKVSADAGADLFRKFLDDNSALPYFREFALGFNPKLVIPAGGEWIPYYGYGAGVVRLSLGNNVELGGAVRGDGVRWFLFNDATVVTASGQVLVRDGALHQF